MSRYLILLEGYSKTLHVEAKTLQAMIRHEFLPALLEQMDKVAVSVRNKKAVFAHLDCGAEESFLTRLAGLPEAGPGRGVDGGRLGHSRKSWRMLWNPRGSIMMRS